MPHTHTPILSPPHHLQRCCVAEAGKQVITVMFSLDWALPPEDKTGTGSNSDTTLGIVLTFHWPLYPPASQPLSPQTHILFSKPTDVLKLISRFPLYIRLLSCLSLCLQRGLVLKPEGLLVDVEVCTAEYIMRCSFSLPLSGVGR